jgi:hypothetical protein
MIRSTVRLRERAYMHWFDGRSLFLSVSHMYVRGGTYCTLTYQRWFSEQIWYLVGTILIVGLSLFPF